MRHTYKKARSRPAAGFSLVEMLIVIVLIGIIAAMAMFSIVGALPNIKVNNGLNTAISVVKNGKYLAVSQRRNYQLGFPVDGNGKTQIQLQRIEVSAATAGPPTPPVDLPGQVQFLLFAGMPDTPDGYGTCPGGICFGATLTQTFLSNGEFVDSVGAPLNGTIYVGIPGNIATQRAITITGATGRIRSYRWTGASWLEY